MVFRIGNLILPSEEYFNELIEKGIIAEYDASPQLREKHDKEIAKKYKKKYYSHEERAKAWRESRRRGTKKINKEKKAPSNDITCINPWIVGGD